MTRPEYLPPSLFMASSRDMARPEETAFIARSCSEFFPELPEPEPELSSSSPPLPEPELSEPDPELSEPELSELESPSLAQAGAARDKSPSQVSIRERNARLVTLLSGPFAPAHFTSSWPVFKTQRLASVFTLASRHLKVVRPEDGSSKAGPSNDSTIGAQAPAPPERH